MSRVGNAWQVGLAAALAAVLAVPAFASACEEEAVHAGVWKFGVIADTQWTKPDDGRNPNTTAADIIQQVNKQFIAHRVKLVVAVGDTVDVGSATSIGTRALYAQELYNAGIGFYPLRGNHEAAESPPDLTSGLELAHAFPQVSNGLNNATPADVTAALLPAADLALNPPASKAGAPFLVGRAFSEPTAVNTANNAVSYSFDYRNARFILLDQFDAAGEYYPSTVPQQLPWISGQLTGPRPEHAFVFSHKNLLGGSHKDNLFGGPIDAKDAGDEFSAADNSKQQNLDAFVTALADGGARYLITGHDHHHYDSIVNAPITPGKSVHQLITASDSSKFYTPAAPFSSNDVPVTQDLFRVGYYIFTVDGPRVTIDYYASDVAFPSAFSTTPVLNFVKRSSTGFSLNGKEFLVPQNGSYTAVADRFDSGDAWTDVAILAGANGMALATNTGRPETAAVNTGWSHRACGTASHELVLWGLAKPMATDPRAAAPALQTDAYVLSMSYDHRSAPARLGTGEFGLAARDASGKWVNAVDLNAGGTKAFVVGPWTAKYGLGTHGVDPRTRTAWAVVNHDGAFRVGPLDEDGVVARCRAEIR